MWGNNERTHTGASRLPKNVTAVTGYPLMIQSGNGKSFLFVEKYRRIIYKWMMFYCDVTLLEECHQLWYRARQSGPPTTRPLIPVPTFSAGLPSMSSCHPKNDRSHQGLPGILGDY